MWFLFFITLLRFGHLNFSIYNPYLSYLCFNFLAERTTTAAENYFTLEFCAFLILNFDNYNFNYLFTLFSEFIFNCCGGHPESKEHFAHCAYTAPPSTPSPPPPLPPPPWLCVLQSTHLSSKCEPSLVAKTFYSDSKRQHQYKIPQNLRSTMLLSFWMCKMFGLVVDKHQSEINAKLQWTRYWNCST